MFTRTNVELTVKEFAAAERVAERTVRRWIEKGAVNVRRNPGGGIRIAISSETTSPTRPVVIQAPQK